MQCSFYRFLNPAPNILQLKAHWQISKKRCFGKYWSCDKACQFSALTELFRKPDNWWQIYKQTSSTFYASNMCLKRVEKEKLWGHHNKDISLNTFAKYMFNYFLKMQKQPPEVFHKKAVFKKWAIFTEKHLCWSPLVIQNIGKSLKNLVTIRM